MRFGSPSLIQDQHWQQKLELHHRRHLGAWGECQLGCPFVDSQLHVCVLEQYRYVPCKGAEEEVEVLLGIHIRNAFKDGQLVARGRRSSLGNIIHPY